MASLDHYALAPKRVQARPRSLSDAQVVLFVTIIFSIVGAFIVGGVATLVFGTLPGWLWLAIIGVQVLAALLVAGATQVANP